MSPVRVLASVLSLLNGLWAVYVQHTHLTPLCGSLCGTSGFTSSPTFWLAVAGTILVADSLVSFAGVRVSFAAGVGLSALVLVIVAVQWRSYVVTDAEVAVALSIVSAALDAVAWRPAKALSEKDSPLNLPVFG